jgi:hypothetical protein
MASGNVQVHGTALGFLLFGWSHQHLWWYADDSRREILIKSGGGTLAFRCRDCGSVVLPSQRVLEERPPATEP